MRKFILCIGILFISVAATAQAMTVFDPTNFTQNLLTAQRELEQINNQVKQYNEMIKEYQDYMNQWTTMLKNPAGVGDTLAQAKQIEQNLAQMKDNLTGMYSQIQSAMQEMQGFADQIANMEIPDGNSVSDFENNTKQMQAKFDSVQQQFNASCKQAGEEFVKQSEERETDRGQIIEKTDGAGDDANRAVSNAAGEANANSESVTAQIAALSKMFAAYVAANGVQEHNNLEMLKNHAAETAAVSAKIQEIEDKKEAQAKLIGEEAIAEHKEAEKIREKLLTTPKSQKITPPPPYKPSGLGRTRPMIGETK